MIDVYFFSFRLINYDVFTRFVMHGDDGNILS